MDSEVNIGLHSPWILPEKVSDNKTFRLVHFTSQKFACYQGQETCFMII